MGTVSASSPRTAVYTPKGVLPHAALLRQACAHCGKFLAAASRRSRGRVSVPVWLIILSDQLPIIATVGRYPTVQLIGRRCLVRRLSPFLTPPTRDASVSGITHRFRWLPPSARQLPHAFLTRPPREPPEGDPVRLACIRHAASVDPEPGSNSPPSAYSSTTPPGRHRLPGCGVMLCVVWCHLGHLPVSWDPAPSSARAPPSPSA